MKKKTIAEIKVLYQILNKYMHFSNSENMWLNRSAILFQLSYKEKTNFDLLKATLNFFKNLLQVTFRKCFHFLRCEYSLFYIKLAKTTKKNANILPVLKKVMGRPFIKVKSVSKGRGRNGNWMVTVTEQTDFFDLGTLKMKTFLKFNFFNQFQSLFYFFFNQFLFKLRQADSKLLKSLP